MTTHINRNIAQGEIESILGMGWTTQVRDHPEGRQRETLGVLTGQSRRVIATMILEAIESHALVEAREHDHEPGDTAELHLPSLAAYTMETP